MKCPICKHGETRAGTTTVTLEVDEGGAAQKPFPKLTGEVAASVLLRAVDGATA